MDAPVALMEESRPALAVSQVTTLDALTIAVQHTVLVTDVQMVCSILQTCKTLRAVLQQSAGQLTIETSTGKLPRLRTHMLSKFATWLPKHAGLVHSVRLWAPRDNPSVIYSPIDNMMAVSFLAARPALRLKSFKADYVVSAEVLQALPTASLTQLHIEGSFYRQAHGLASNSSATLLEQLSGLQDLSLKCAYHQDPLSSNVLAVVNKLSCLSRLHLSWMSADCSLELLPQRLEQLSLSAHCGTQPLMLQHLTGLKHLELRLHGTPADGSGLPNTLTGLDLSFVGNVATHVLQRQLGLQMLTRLQSLKATNSLESQEDLKGLASLTSLTELHMEYSKLDQAIAAAPGWKHLTSLHSLRFASPNGGQTLSDQEARVLLAGVRSATSLTKLEISTSGWICDDFLLPEDVMLCQYLTDLKQLKQLTLVYCGGLSVQEAVLPMTSLSGLTHLVVVGADGLNDVAATAIARQLQELRDLEIMHCGLTSASFPAIGTLQQLTHLALSGEDITGMQDQDIMSLTTLTGLKKLNVGGVFSADATNAFWAAVGGRPMD